MGADVWLVKDDEQIALDPGDLDAEMRALVPRRSAGGYDDTTVHLTYNLTPMLREAGFPGWGEIVGRSACEVAPILRDVLARLVTTPDWSRTLEPKNGWGTYEDAVAALSVLASACERNPQARIEGWL